MPEQPMHDPLESPAPKRIARKKLIERWLEVIAALMLGAIAVATAWSGYQGARWGGIQTINYSQATAKRVESTRTWTLAGQDRLFDVSLFNEWLDANYQDETGLANEYEKRFRHEFRPAFSAWLATDPFNHPSAPPSPLYMPEYKLSLVEQAEQLESAAAASFEAGKDAYQHSTAYLLNTVFLATVLFFITIAQRFEWTPIKIVILSLAFMMLLLGLYRLFTFPVA